MFSFTTTRFESTRGTPEACRRQFFARCKQSKRRKAAPKFEAERSVAEWSFKFHLASNFVCFPTALFLTIPASPSLAPINESPAADNKQAMAPEPETRRVNRVYANFVPAEKATQSAETTSAEQTSPQNPAPSAQQPFANIDAVKTMEEQKRIKQAYFWYKLEYFFSSLSLASIAFPLAIDGDATKRTVCAIVLLAAFAGLYYYAQRHHRELAGVARELSTEDEEKLDSLYERMFGKKLKAIGAVGIIIFIAVFLLAHGTYAVGASLKLAFLVWTLSMVILTMIWTFKLLGILLVIMAVGLLFLAGLGSFFGGYQEDADTTQYYAGENQEVQSSVAEILDARLSTKNDRDLVIVTYAWTNTTEKTAKPVFNVTVKAFQNGIELEFPIVSDAESGLAGKDIRPGVRVEIEKAFYLRDMSDVEVEITPYMDFYSGTVYARRVFSDLNGPAASSNTENPVQGEVSSVSDAEYTNEGLRLTIPAEYADLVSVATPSALAVNRKTLFSVSERIPGEERKQISSFQWSYGELFEIREVDEDTLYEILQDPYGEVIFGADGQGHYYILIYPDHEMFYQNSNFSEAGKEQWDRLLEWSETVPNRFIADNPSLYSYTP